MVCCYTEFETGKLRLQGFSGTVMRGFGRFSEEEQTQIALQTSNLVELPIISADVGDFRQRCHSDAPLSGWRTSLSDSGFFLQQRQRVVGCHNWRVFVFTGQFDLYE